MTEEEISVWEARERRWKPGSVSEKAFVGVERPGSLEEGIGFEVRDLAERNWNYPWC